MTTTTLKPTVRGVGINDVRGSTGTPYKQVWNDMLHRCYSATRHVTNPTYIGCTVDPRWHHLSDFKQWYEQQGDVTGKQLDKDIISPGNRVYGPDTCIFVSHQLNNFFITRQNGRGKYPIGVRIHLEQKRKKPFMTQVHDGSKQKYIGYYHTPEEAYQAFIQAKKEILLENFILPETDQQLKQALYNVYNNMEEYFK